MSEFTLQCRFLDLANTFRIISCEEDVAADNFVKEYSCEAMRLIKLILDKRHHYTGFCKYGIKLNVNWSNFPWPTNWESHHSTLWDQDEWLQCWFMLCTQMSREYPMSIGVDTHCLGDLGETRVEDWRIRRHEFSLVCEVIAEHLIEDHLAGHKSGESSHGGQ